MLPELLPGDAVDFYRVTLFTNSWRTIMKKFFYNLLGILLFGALLSGIFMISEYARIEREKESTAVSTRFQIVDRTGYIFQDPTIIIPGMEPGSLYRLKAGRDSSVIIDFSNEPGIHEFYKSNQEQFYRMSGILRNETHSTSSGGKLEIQVLEVLHLRILKVR